MYAATDGQTAEFYLRQLGPSAVPLELRVDLHRVLRAPISSFIVEHPLHQLLALVPDGLRRFLDAGFRDRDRSTALTRLLTEEGYDALEIVTDRLNPAIGGNQLVVFSPRAIVVVGDEDIDTRRGDDG